MLLPIASKETLRWSQISKDYSDEMADVIFDFVVAFISWIKRLNPTGFNEINSTINLVHLQEIFIIGGDLTHVLAFPGKVHDCLKADKAFEALKSVLRLIRTVASIAKLFFDHAIIASAKGHNIASKIKFSAWSISGAISVGENIVALYKPDEKQKKYGTPILTLSLMQSIAFLALGTVKLFNRPRLNHYMLPIASIVLVLASITFIAKRVIDSKEAPLKV